MDKLKKLAESVPHLVWTCQGDGPCDYLSPQWIEYTGIPAEDQLGYGWLEQIHPDDRSRTAARWQEAVATRSPMDVDFRIRRHDGVYRWFKTRAVPEVDDEGRILRWYGTNTDIQELLDAREAVAVLNAELEARVADRTRELEAVTLQLEEAQRVSHTGSWSMEVATGQMTWSAELFRILRLPPEDGPPPYEVHSDLFTPESWALLEPAVAAALEHGTPYEITLELADRSEGRRWAVARATVERDDTGRVARIYGTFQEVTELVQARLDRDRAAERALAATSYAEIGVWEWNVPADELVWNAQMYQLYAVDSAVAPDYGTWLSRLHPDDADRAEAVLREAVAGADEFHDTFRIRRPDGEVRFVRASARIFRGPDGEAHRLVGINWDVTAEELAAAASERSVELLRGFVRDAPAAIAMFDRELRYIAASDQWRRDYRLADAVLEGRSHYEVFPEIPEEWKTIHRACLDGAVQRRDADRFEREDGTVAFLQWEVRPWYTSEGQIGGITMFTRDVSRAEAMRETLRLRSEALSQSNRDLKQFAYAASHDLQEPLRAVAGCAQILSSRYAGHLDREADELIEHMVDGAKRMRNLIEDLLAYSRVETRGSRFSRVEVARCLEEALANLVDAVRRSGARVEAGDLHDVHADARQVTQLLQNVLGNAIKYAGDAPPVIAIRSWQAGAEVTVAVRDRGMGIPPEHRERVFEMFQRLQSGTEGTGVGLALCRRIVERHRGRIWVEEVEGPGTEIRFTLPAAVEVAA